MNRWLVGLGIGLAGMCLTATVACNLWFQRYIDATAFDYLLAGLIWAPGFLLAGAFVVMGMVKE